MCFAFVNNDLSNDICPELDLMRECGIPSDQITNEPYSSIFNS